MVNMNMKKIIISLILFYLRFFAKIALVIHRPKIIGIAGSAGKSSTKNAIEAILKDHFRVVALKGNSEVGLPLSLLGIQLDLYSKENIKIWLKLLLLVPLGITYLKKFEYLIVEMGIDDPLPPKNMTYLLKIIKPDIALSLNISGTHTEQFEKILPENQQMNSLEKHEHILNKMAEEDTKIITQSNCSCAFYNDDDQYLKRALQNYIKNNHTKCKSFGKNKNNTLSFLDYQVDLTKSMFSFLSTEGEIKIEFSQMLLPQVYQYTFGAAIVAGLECGLTLEQIKTALSKNFQLPKSRSSLLLGKKNSIIIDSSYNASKQPVLTFLDLAFSLKKQTKRPLVFIFGDMRELGQFAKSEHEEVAQKINQTVDALYCVGELSKKYVLPQIKTNTEISVKWFSHALALGRHLKENLPVNALLLFKGSQNTIFLEEAVKILLQNPSDSKKLCRQEPFWLKQKEKYWQQVN